MRPFPLERERGNLTERSKSCYSNGGLQDKPTTRGAPPDWARCVLLPPRD